jgi:hypothetical protein
MTAYLECTYRITPFPKAWAEQIVPLLQCDNVAQLVDLGSGSGGPVALVLEALAERGLRVRAVLTDLYPPAIPRPGGSSAKIQYCAKPVDAANVPAELVGIRTMFASFHHFRPEPARKILSDAFACRRPICVFETTSRTLAAVLSAILIPVLVLVLTPRIRPLSWQQVIFTYLIPILPLLMFWDGFVSQLRTYSVEELTQLTKDLKADDYSWEIGEIKLPRLPAGVPYLIGRGALGGGAPR